MRTAFVRVQHLKHGINASEWFAQHASDYSAAFTGRYTDEADIALMAKLGFDNVRLSIDPVPLEQSMNHWGSSNGDFLARLDRAVDVDTGRPIEEAGFWPDQARRFASCATRERIPGLAGPSGRSCSTSRLAWSPPLPRGTRRST